MQEGWVHVSVHVIASYNSGIAKTSSNEKVNSKYFCLQTYICIFLFTDIVVYFGFTHVQLYIFVVQTCICIFLLYRRTFVYFCLKDVHLYIFV